VNQILLVYFILIAFDMNDEDRLNNVSFEEQISNPKYIKPLRMNFERVYFICLFIIWLFLARTKVAMGNELYRRLVQRNRLSFRS
jgi:hypothetical protein